MESIIKEKGTIRARFDELVNAFKELKIDPEVTSINTFGLACGRSTAWAKGFKSDKLLPRQVNAIRDRFPYININWLITGEGEMFDYIPEKKKTDEDTDALAAQVAVLFQQVADLLESNKKLQEKIDKLEGKIG